MRKVAFLLSAMLCAITFSGCASEPAPTTTSPMGLDTLELLERGEYLARAANCVACHTPKGAAPYSGGKAMNTPFGVIYSSNLTSDKSSGLGDWNEDDFWQALHQGKSRDGSSLYPAFPYASYTLIVREDSDALFAYFQTIPAVSAQVPDHEVRFPFNTPFALSVWRQFFFKPGVFVADAAQSVSWNRGAYLVEGLGHCGECHTPRGVFGNTQSGSTLAGAYVESLGWDALPLATGLLAPQEQREMVTLLKTGANKRDQLSGPMAEVVFHSLQYLDTEHLGDMTEYMASLPITPAQLRPSLQISVTAARQLSKEGEAIYSEHCADCHGVDGLGKAHQYPALAANKGVIAASPNNAIRMVKHGGFGASTTARPRPYSMPPYAHQLSAREIAAVLNYLRSAWGNAASAVSPQDVWRD